MHKLAGSTPTISERGPRPPVISECAWQQERAAKCELSNARSLAEGPESRRSQCDGRLSKFRSGAAETTRRFGWNALWVHAFSLAEVMRAGGMHARMHF
jgi:hypothetical protein